MKSTIILIVLILAVGATLYFFTPLFENAGEGNEVQVVDFHTCVEAGNAVMESYPRQCRDAEGNSYVEEVGNVVEKSNLIRVNSPRPNDEVSSPLKITGEARGYWFFEATFPVVITNWDGLIIGEHYAEAVLDPNDPSSTWMTEDFVPFELELIFDDPYNEGDPSFMKRGSLILHKSNASGLPEHDDALEFPILFE